MIEEALADSAAVQTRVEDLKRHGLSHKALLAIDPKHPTENDLLQVGLLAMLPKHGIKSFEELDN